MRGRNAPVERATPIDEQAIRAALHKRGFHGSDFGSLEWEGDGGYVTVDVSSHHVDGTSGGDEVMDQVMSALELLQARGLHVWDPQQGDWFPG